MNKAELEKLMKDKLVKDGVSKKWIDEKMIFVNFDDLEEEEWVMKIKFMTTTKTR